MQYMITNYNNITYKMLLYNVFNLFEIEKSVHININTKNDET